MDDFATYYSRAANICSRTEKCSSEIRNSILSWGADKETTDKVVEKLTDEKFIDDVRYAASYVKDKFRLNQWGRIKISFLLRQKGISSDIISDALTSIDEDDYREVLTKLISEKEKKTTARNLYERKSKLLRFAQSHGFENDLIFQILSSLYKK